MKPTKASALQTKLYHAERTLEYWQNEYDETVSTRRSWDYADEYHAYLNRVKSNLDSARVEVEYVENEITDLARKNKKSAKAEHITTQIKREMGL